MSELDALFSRLAENNFRRRFKLGSQEKTYLRAKGLEVVMEHARQFIMERVAAAEPVNDGKQTPMKGHPVFIAQHATATCCRGCLSKWHGIEEGAPLTAAEVDYILSVIRKWLEKGSLV